MDKKRVVEKIDFKIDKEKKDALKSKAYNQGVTVSYIMNELVDNYLESENYIKNRKEISTHLVRLMQAIQYEEKNELREYIQLEAEAILCLM